MTVKGTLSALLILSAISSAALVAEARGGDRGGNDNSDVFRRRGGDGGGDNNGGGGGDRWRGGGGRGNDNNNGGGHDRWRGGGNDGGGWTKPDRPSRPDRGNNDGGGRGPGIPDWKPDRPSRPDHGNNNGGGNGRPDRGGDWKDRWKDRDRDNKPGHGDNNGRPDWNKPGRPDHGNNDGGGRGPGRGDWDKWKDRWKDRDNRPGHGDNRPDRPDWNRPNKPGHGDNKPGHDWDRDKDRDHGKGGGWKHGRGNFRRDFRGRQHWPNRYDRWWNRCDRPSRVYVSIRWYTSMPDYGYWDRIQIKKVAQNLEYLTSEIYDTMDDVAPENTEYGMRLRRVLSELADAAENFADVAGSSRDSGIYDLFYLESKVKLAETTLDGYSQAYRVKDEMRALRYYVDELLWMYRQGRF